MDCEAVDAGSRPCCKTPPTPGRRWTAPGRSPLATSPHAGCFSAAALPACGADFADFRGLQIWIDRFADSEAAAPGLSRPGNQLCVDAARVLLPRLTQDHPLDAPAAKAASARLFDALRGGQWPGGDEHLMLAKALYD